MKVIKHYCDCCKKELKGSEMGTDFCIACMLEYSDFVARYYRGF